MSAWIRPETANSISAKPPAELMAPWRSPWPAVRRRSNRRNLKRLAPRFFKFREWWRSDPLEDLLIFGGIVLGTAGAALIDGKFGLFVAGGLVLLLVRAL